MLTTKNKLRIATRKSPLAMWQAEHVAKALQDIHPGLRVELLGIQTQGDKILDTPLAKIGGKGLFVKELENCMLHNQADIAVHSMKDVTVTLPDGLHLPVILRREDPHDAFVSANYAALSELPENARIGTSSLRRKSQIQHQRPDLQILPLRGNVNTRLRKLDEQLYDAIILAAAGLTRLGLAARIRSTIAVADCLPAVGQGALGIECRIEDQSTNDLIARLHDPDTASCVMAERAMNNRLEGGCQVPIGGYAILRNKQIWLRGLVSAVDGTQMVRAEMSAEPEHFEELGIAVAEELLKKGADKILQTLYHP